MPASAENSSPATATSRSATLSPMAQPPNLLLRTQMKMATATSSSTPNADIIAVCPVIICHPPVSKQSHYSGANQRARSWSRSGSCHDWENTWITLMPARTWETPCDSLRRSPAETTLTVDSCASRLKTGYENQGESQGLGYVMVIVWVEASHCTSAPRLSATKRRGSIVRLFRIRGTTFGFVLSMSVDLPFTNALDFPMTSLSLVPPSDMVTVWLTASQATVPPSDSTTTRIGTSVR